GQLPAITLYRPTPDSLICSLYCSGDHRDLHSFPTRRSSDLVYRGTRVPELVGKYLYADYVTGRLWALEYDEKTGQVKANYSIQEDRKSTRLNSSHVKISYAVFCLKKKNKAAKI